MPNCLIFALNSSWKKKWFLKDPKFGKPFYNVKAILRLALK